MIVVVGARVVVVVAACVVVGARVVVAARVIAVVDAGVVVVAPWVVTVVGGGAGVAEGAVAATTPSEAIGSDVPAGAAQAATAIAPDTRSPSSGQGARQQCRLRPKRTLRNGVTSSSRVSWPGAFDFVSSRAIAVLPQHRHLKRRSEPTRTHRRTALNRRPSENRTKCRGPRHGWSPAFADGQRPHRSGAHVQVSSATSGSGSPNCSAADALRFGAGRCHAVRSCTTSS